MKSMKSIKWSFLLVPVISAFLLVTIVTAAPTTITEDLYTKQQPTTIQKSAAETLPTAVAVNSTPPSNTNEASPAKANNLSLSALAEQRQARQTQISRSISTPKPSRSISTPSNSSSNSPSQTSKASAIIATGQRYIGVPYLYGGTTPAGFDCSGFVQYVFAKNGISLPRVSRDQFQVGTSVSFSNLQPGDLVFFSLAKNGVVDHEGIYVGNNQFINAASSKGVTIYTLGSYWQSAYVGAKRVL
ncbi:C40 family peptidase [Desulfosporosinus metallidurans]|uniref:Cell wall lytic activity n=1 Tax=Desulfosporosinus metallidurans TaxID=1888891 RepID=A0A1Q8QQU3_9FIRM|nr:C40 family peptidase [Desulfosporosinus metallidurans]OLN29719.1 cell wall lytic activity [Desulfosporosinus metallidurans]